MKAGPILMHARSIQNLLAGRKTQTRRIVKRMWGALHAQAWSMKDGSFEYADNDGWHEAKPPVCPYGVVGDLLWVRERHAINAVMKSSSRADPHWIAAIEYSDGLEREFIFDVEPKTTRERGEAGGWRPSIHMPRRLSRLTLELTDVRVERVQDCSAEDAMAEGIRYEPGRGYTFDGRDLLPIPLPVFQHLWDDTNGPGAWQRNDWCWALTFKVHRANVDAVLAQASDSRVDCGECPNVTSGCRAGHCLRAPRAGYLGNINPPGTDPDVR